jgi:hypothetical protein
MKRNYNLDDLHLETDAGFILGQSLLGLDKITDEAHSWQDVKADFTSISLTRSVAVDKGVWFRPETAVLTIRTNSAEYLEGTFGKRMRLRYKDTILFEGKVKGAKLVADKHDKNNVMTLTAVDQTEALNNFVQMYFSAPEETAGERIKRLLPEAVVIGCDRIMAARGESSVKLMTLLQEAADAQLARFYINANNELVIDGTPATSPIVTFSDEKGGGIEYTALDFSEDTQYAITGAVVEAGSDETGYITASNFHESAVIDNEEKYSPAIPFRQTDVNAWAASFPVQPATSFSPSTIDANWSEAVGNVDLLDLVRVRWNGRQYDAGVVGIELNITPYWWSTSFDLIPGALVRKENVLAPSEVRGFQVSEVTDTSVTLTWTRPQVLNSTSGFEIRFKEGDVPPASRTDGTLVTTASVSSTSYTHGNRVPDKTYSYSIWAVTTVDDVYSVMSTATAATKETIPTAVRNFAVYRGANAGVQTLTWDAPTTPGANFAGYTIFAGGAAGSGSLDVGTQTSYTYSDLARNTSYDWWVKPRTAKSQFGPSSPVITKDTTEVIPGAVPNISVTSNAWNHVFGSWGTAPDAQDISHYLVKWNVNGGGPSLEPWHQSTFAYTTKGLDWTIPDAQGDSFYDLSVWPVTVGGKYGPRASAWVKTAQGIFNQYWEGEAAWTGTYLGDDSRRTFSGSDDLYYGYISGGNGMQKSMVGWSLPSNIQGAYAIDRVELHIYNKHTYNNSGATCWFGVHNAGSMPIGFFQTAGNLATYHMSKPGWIGADATGWLAGHLHGGARGVTLGPPPNTSSSYYGYAAGTSGPRPVLKVWYRTQA